jgi:hypothetical protein
MTSQACRRLHTVLVALLAVIVVFVARLPVSWADGPSEPSPLLFVGREAEVRALYQPHAVGDTLGPAAAGFRLSAVEVTAERASFRVRGPSGAAWTLHLEHPARAPSGTLHVGSFAYVREPPQGAERDPSAEAALDEIAATLQGNDRGRFWGSRVHARSDATSPPAPELLSPFRDATGVGSFIKALGTWFHLTFLDDGSIILIGAIVFLALHLRRVLADLPRWVSLALLGLFCAGLGLRLLMSLPTIMNAFPYRRVVPLARLVASHRATSWLLDDTGAEIYLTEVIFKTDVLVAAVTPVVLFAHARYVLKDYRPALFAAGMLVLLPMHIRFSYSDTEVIQSICSSSLTFVVLYTALREPSVVWRAACFVLLPAMALATYWVRPENMSLYLLDVWAVLLTAGDDVPRSRRILVMLEVTAASAYAFVFHLMPGYSGMVQTALGMTTLKHLWQMVHERPSMITFLNPYFMPPGFIALVVIGGVALYRQGERLRMLFLVSWALGMFVVMSTVLNGVPAMEERYHLNMITPLCMLAAASWPVLVRARPRVRWAAFVYLAASPLLHFASIRDSDFNEMHEFDFLRSHRDEIPAGCAVLEFQPAMTHQRIHDRDTRIGRIGTMFDGAGELSRWYVVSSGAFPAPTRDLAQAEELTPEAVSLIEHPPACLYVYEGISCFSHRPMGSPIAPVCAELRRRLPLTRVASIPFRSRLYDEVNAGRLIDEPGGGMRNGARLVDNGDDLEISLLRVAPPE